MFSKAIAKIRKIATPVKTDAIPNPVFFFQKYNMTKNKAASTMHVAATKKLQENKVQNPPANLIIHILNTILGKHNQAINFRKPMAVTHFSVSQLG